MPAPVLDPGRGRTKKGYFWAIARDDRPWGGTDPPAIAYAYAPGRGAVHACRAGEDRRFGLLSSALAAFARYRPSRPPVDRVTRLRLRSLHVAT